MRQGPHQSAQKSTSIGTGASWTISSNKISPTAKGLESGGNGELHLMQRPVLTSYYSELGDFADACLLWFQIRCV
jgi:hypothetical protein